MREGWKREEGENRLGSAREGGERESKKRLSTEGVREGMGFWEGLGWRIGEVESLREERKVKGKEVMERERRVQRDTRWEMIRGSKFNKWCRRVKGEGVPGYLKKGWGESRWQRQARFRLGNEMRIGTRRMHRGGYVECLKGRKKLGNT